VKLPEEYRRRYGFQVHIDEVEKGIRQWAVRLALSTRILIPVRSSILFSGGTYCMT